MPEIITEETPQMGKEGGDSVHQVVEYIGDMVEPGGYKGETPIEAEVQKVSQPVVSKKKKTGPKKATTPTKSIPASTLIEKLNEQIVMVSWIDGISPGDVPQGTTLSKAGRELLIELQKAIEALKVEYINKVQSL